MDGQTAIAMGHEFGPALLICLTVVLGFFFQNGRFNDISKRIDDTNKRIDELGASLRSLIELQMGSLDRRVAALENPPSLTRR